jgi:5-methylcytosine-specific restriction protein B
MLLLEYRDHAIPLAGGGSFSLPGNIVILATMNTADRSIALVDHALRRRFAFIHLQPNYDLLTQFHTQTSFDPAPLIATLQRLNTQIGDPHYHLGHTYFLNANLQTELPSIWQLEIEPTLEEYFFDRPDLVEEFRWENLSVNGDR